MTKIGILLPTRGALFNNAPGSAWELISAMACECDSLALHSVWVGDSLSAKPRFEPLTVLAALAQRTENIKLGTSVLLPVLRSPGHLLQTINTLGSISGGRLIMGMGLGGAFNEAQKREWQNVGIDYKTRRARFEEVLEILHTSRNHKLVDFKGDYYQISKLEMNQKDENPFAIVVAAHARHGLDIQFQRAARYGDGFISITDSPEEFEKGSRMFDAFRDSNYEKGVPVEKIMYVTINIDSNDKNAFDEATAFLTEYYGANIWGDAWGPFGSPSRIIERINSYAQSGATTVIVRFASFDQLSQLRRFVNDVLPNID